MIEFWIWDKEADQWNGNIFHDFDYAEGYVLAHGGYSKYDIFEKLT